MSSIDDDVKRALDNYYRYQQERRNIYIVAAPVWFFLGVLVGALSIYCGILVTQ